jgi:membrane fusion protein, multidrug efflux system
MVTDEPSQTTTLEAPSETSPGTPGGGTASGASDTSDASDASKKAAAARREEPTTPPHRPIPPSSEPPPPALRRKRWPWVVLAAAAAVAIYLLVSSHSRTQANAAAAKAKAAASAPVPVMAAAARTGEIPVYLTGLGSVTALNTAVVKSRVDGQLFRIDFHEGQMVKEGQLLAELDPRPFQVQLMQAQGQKAKDEAALQNARVDLNRYQILMKEDAIPKQQLDTQAATVKQDEAAVQSDQAQVESAKLNLAYCRIAAPIAGRVGLRLVDTGNIVHASDANGIVMINEVQPITVIFTIAADRLPQVLQQMHTGRQLQVDAFDRDLKNRLAGGTLAAVDNQIDQTTGTVRLRAVFPNQEDALFPSQFVNARLLVDTLRNTVLVPTAAIQRSPTQIFVYHVKPDQTVETRNVVVQLTEGDTTALRGGLAPGELVVTDGVDRLRPGMKVAPTMADANGSLPAAAGAAGAGPAGAAGPAAGQSPQGAAPAPATSPAAGRRRGTAR